MEVKVSWNGPSGMSFRAETGSEAHPRRAVPADFDFHCILPCVIQAVYSKAYTEST